MRPLHLFQFGVVSVAAAALYAAAMLAQGTITTFAGTGVAGYSGDGGPAAAAQVNTPSGVAVDSSGNAYIADAKNHVVRKIDGATGIITTYAGTGAMGYTGDGGPATAAKIQHPEDVAVDASGNLYLTQDNKHVVRKVDKTTGIITTYAGTGVGGYTGDGGPATSATLRVPIAIAWDGSDYLYIADKKKHVVRRVDGTTGIITTYAGTGVGGYTGDGGPATAAKIGIMWGVAVDGSGHLYIAVKNHHVVRKVDRTTGIITTYAGTGKSGYIGDGGPATVARLYQPQDVAFDSAGNLYIADSGNHVVRKVDGATGTITTYAGTGVKGYSGDGGPASAAQMDSPLGIGVRTATGDVFIACGSKNYDVVRKVEGPGLATMKIVTWQEIQP